MLRKMADPSTAATTVSKYWENENVMLSTTPATTNTTIDITTALAT
jgi:hypothetical protein